MRPRIFELKWPVGAAILTYCGLSAGAPSVRTSSGPGAEDCPQAAELLAEIQTLRRSREAPGATVYDVAFSADGEHLVATIRVGNASRRVLRARGPRCAGLAHATVVTLALLFDFDDEAEAAKQNPAESPARTTAPFVPGERGPRLYGTFELGTGVLLGWVGPITPTLGLQSGLHSPNYALELDAWWALPRTFALEPGSVRETLGAGSLEFCRRLLGSARLGVSACGGVVLGALSGKSAGFSVNAEHERLWLALPLALEFERISRGAGFAFSASTLTDLIGRDFNVPGAGVAYRSWPVGLMFSLRGVLAIGASD